MKRNVLFLCLTAMLFCACRGEGNPQDVAARFLSAYLECRFSDALEWTSPEVAEMMHWRASNLTQAEVELLNENVPQVEVEDVEDYGDSCIVSLKVSDALILDSVGQPGHVDDCSYRLILKKEKGSNWKVTALSSL